MDRNTITGIILIFAIFIGFSVYNSNRANKQFEKSVQVAESYYAKGEYENARAECLLPIGLAKGAKVIRPVRMDTPITCTDVEIKPSTVYSLRQLQEQWFEGGIGELELLKAVDALAND